MMFVVLIIAALTLVYTFALASFAWQDFVVGALLSTGLVAMYFRWVFPYSLPQAEFVWHIIVRLPIFLFFLVIDILKGTWAVATYVIGIRKLEHPGIVKIPFENHSDRTVGVIGHIFITLSPGSFVVDIDWDDRTMLVHYMDASDPAKLRAEVEKYYRLWEYGSHMPPPRVSRATDEGGSANA